MINLTESAVLPQSFSDKNHSLSICNRRLIQFGDPYTFPGKQNQLLSFRAWFFEGLISRVLYLGGGDGLTDYARDANELARLIV